MRFIPALLWAGLIFWVSAQSRLPQAPFFFDGADKIYHAGEYGIFALLVLFGDRWPRSLRAFLWVLPLAAYAATDEYHQSFVPGRTADVLDWLADSGGATLAVGSWLGLRDHHLGKWLSGRGG